METGDPQITAAIINITDIIIGSIIGGIFIIIAALIPFLFRKRELPIPKTPVVEDDKGEKKEEEKKNRKKFFAFFGIKFEDSEGEKKAKIITTIQIFFLSFGIIFVVFGISLAIIRYISHLPNKSGDVLVNIPTNTNVDMEGISVNLNFNSWYPWGGVSKANGATSNECIINSSGRLPDSAGIVNANLGTSLRGKTLILCFSNTSASRFSEGRMAKLECDDLELLSDNTFSTMGYLPEEDRLLPNGFEFKIPDTFNGKLNIVFYQAELKDLKITAYYK